jgi:hypothetical protein
MGKMAWRGLLIMTLEGIGAGILNVLVFILVFDPLVAGSKADEVAVSTYSINFFVGWVFFSAWFLSKADEEWKKAAEAVAKLDRATFMLEAPKRIAPSIRVLYLLISLLVVLSFHMFHLENPVIMFETQFGVGFLVATTIMVLWDLDDPIGGVINIPDIPAEWVKELEKKER